VAAIFERETKYSYNFIQQILTLRREEFNHLDREFVEHLLSLPNFLSRLLYTTPSPH
jgi:hypothetical protein